MQAKAKVKSKMGRPTGPSMPCGWGCGAMLTATQIREHFVTCRKRPRPLAPDAPPRSARGSADHGAERIRLFMAVEVASELRASQQQSDSHGVEHQNTILYITCYCNLGP